MPYCIDLHTYIRCDTAHVLHNVNYSAVIKHTHIPTHTHMQTLLFSLALWGCCSHDDSLSCCVDLVPDGYADP